MMRVLLLRVRSSAPSRLAAALVATILSGVPALAAHPEDRPHRCACHHRPGEACACARCHAATAKARRAEAAKAPPCHRAQAVARAEAESAREAPRDVPGAPCLRGSCGAPEPPAVTPSGLEGFVLTVPPALPVPAVAGRAIAQVPRGAVVARAPETPPPRLLAA